MNPRARQYALGGTLSGWTRLAGMSAKQEFALRTAYLGVNPMVVSRYGWHQWAAPWPRTRVIVKDPFAMLSIPAISEVTGAIPILIFRHPAAVLFSYRRLGWKADVQEIQSLVKDLPGRMAGRLPEGPTGESSDIASMAFFWNALHELALGANEGSRGLIILDHEELATGGISATERLFKVLSLQLGRGTSTMLNREGEGTLSRTALHNLERPPSNAARAWRQGISEAEIAEMEDLTSATRLRLHERRLRLDEP